MAAVTAATVARALVVPPELVAAARHLYAEGWRHDGWTLRGPDGHTTVDWDWHQPGADPSTVAPADATWMVSVGRRVDGRWHTALDAEVASVAQAVDLLVDVGVLPVRLHSVYRALARQLGAVAQ